MVKRTKKLTVTIGGEGGEKPLISFTVKRSALIFIMAGVLLAVMVAAYLITSFTPLRKTVYGYPSEESRQRAVENLVKMDSLERVINMWAFQMENIRRIADGKKPFSPDSLISSAESVARVENRNIYASEDSTLRSEVLMQERLNIPAGAEQRHIAQMEGLIFFTPVKGLLTKAFDTDLKHPYVDVAATPETMVHSVLDGTVVSAYANAGMGYTIEVMHNGDMLSVYKYSEKLLKRVGDKVKAGTPIAVVGDSEGISPDGTHIHFELWHKGEAIDPTLYIKF